MDRYAQVTSPLRRYLDLVIHQQLRAFLQDQTLLEQQQIIERIGATASIQRDLRRTERLSRRHWTLVYLIQHPDWQGEGVIVEKHGRRYSTILPDLDLDTDLYLAAENMLNSSVLLTIQDVNLAYLNTSFTKVTSPQSP
jgi:exoribonuclease-2